MLHSGKATLLRLDSRPQKSPTDAWDHRSETAKPS